MKLKDIAIELVNLGIIETPINVIADIVMGFNILKAMETKTNDESSLFYHIVKTLTIHGFHGTKIEAMQIWQGLTPLNEGV